ncbi:ATP-dependent helicase [bacterium]|nr:MAG: ATP-dependent helicase [bacterium]
MPHSSGASPRRSRRRASHETRAAYRHFPSQCRCASTWALRVVHAATPPRRRTIRGRAAAAPPRNVGPLPHIQGVPLSSSIPRWTLSLRAWQRDACETWWRTRPRDALIVACPGAGKTRFATRLAHALLESRLIDRVVVVVPKDHLKAQVARAMAQAGVQLDPGFENAVGRIAPDLHGAVVSYQQVAFAPGVYARLVGERTLVVLDEIHHAGDGATWGRALKRAFVHAAHRVAMSGTPFRSDGAAIPFVRYELGVSIADFTYSYSQALADGVCRPLAFPLLGGAAEWISADGTIIQSDFDSALETRQQESERLRTALTQDGWMGHVATRAHQALHEIRAQGHADAAGLVVAMNQQHAHYVADVIERYAGVKPVVVVSEDNDAAKKIHRFAGSRQPWIVAVHMISEGVDIPRLRVGIYATNVTTPMYFRQFCGRFVRTQAHLAHEQLAYVFVPDDPHLRPLAGAIHAEVEHHLRKHDHREFVPQASPNAPQRYEELSLFSGIAAVAVDRGVLHSGIGMDPLFPLDEPVVEAVPMEPVLKAGEKAALRKAVNSLVSLASARFHVDHRKIHATLNQRFGGSLPTASERELQRRHAELLRWLQRNRYDGIA